METEKERRRGQLQEHRSAVTERAALIDTVLEPLGDLDRLREDIRQNKAELRYSLWYCWQLGYASRQADEHVINGTRPDPTRDHR